MLQAKKKMTMNLPPETDFRIYLQDELIRRCKINPKYSLRAFAEFLQIEPSFLSKLLNQKRSITEATLFKFGKKLGLSPAEIEDFKNTLLYNQDKKKPEQHEMNPMAFRELTMDQFQMIADWYHYAILELITIKNFQPSYRWIAKVLGISVTETRAAVERLVRLGCLEITNDGKWINKSGNNTTLGNDFTDVAFRRLQKQILEMAISAMEEVPLERRDQTSMTIALDSKLLSEAKRRTKNFRRELTEFLQKNQTRDAVYHLSLSLYPVTRLKEQTNRKLKRRGEI